MRILVHDFAGHAFQVSLSRELARRGHTVAHAYCASLVTTPQAALVRRADDPPGLSFHPVDLGSPIRKQAFARRYLQERRYGRLAARLVSTLRPEVVLSGNTPLDAQGRILAATSRVGARYVFWVQDLIGVASARLLREKLPLVGGIIGDHYARMEERQIRASDALVLITEDFVEALPAIKRHPGRHVIPNWAAIDELPVLGRDNEWALNQGLSERIRFIYSGTLGMKHNPGLLLRLARDLPEADVIVISQGAGTDWLREHGQGVNNLRLLPFQPHERVPEVMAAADVLVAVLEPDAGVFSVPSKVLSYLCAERALLLAVPSANLAARIVARTGAGLLAAPGDQEAFVSAATQLAEDPALRLRCGKRAREYAEANFDVGGVTDRFEQVLWGREQTVGAG